MENNIGTDEKKKHARFRIPHVFVLLTVIIFFCSLLTYIIPAGSYDREIKVIKGIERHIVISDTYQTYSKTITLHAIIWGAKNPNEISPVSFTSFLSAIPRGMVKAADIIFFIFIIGGVFGILQQTGVITATIQKLLNIFGNHAYILTIVIMTVLAIGGSTLGMGEEFIPLVPLFLIVSKKLGFDRIYGLALVMLSADIGFAAATTNPFTVSVAQGIAQLPLNSGILLRIIFLTGCLVITFIYLFRYGNKVKKNPAASYMGADDFNDLEITYQQYAFKKHHLIIILTAITIFCYILFAVQFKNWWIVEMAGGFLLIGYSAIFISRMSLADASTAFVNGMREMVIAALVVGFARGIEVVLQEGMILDTLIYYASSLLYHLPKIIAAEGMLVLQSLLNLFIPSGSGQAMVTMPIMAPLADVLSLTRQTAVFAFTCGDGFSNSIIPTSGILMAMLSLAKIPFDKWLRFMLPLFLCLMIFAGIFLAIAVMINYQ
jgi:uncharacterized ion transporter superfamily protein YfcC